MFCGCYDFITPLICMGYIIASQRAAEWNVTGIQMKGFFACHNVSDKSLA